MQIDLQLRSFGRDSLLGGGRGAAQQVCQREEASSALPARLRRRKFGGDGNLTNGERRTDYSLRKKNWNKKRPWSLMVLKREEKAEKTGKQQTSSATV